MYLRMPGFRQTGPGARAAHLELELLYLTASSRFNLCVTLFFLSYIDILLPILYYCKPENRASAKNITYSGSHSQQAAEPASSPHLSSPSPPHHLPLLSFSTLPDSKCPEDRLWIDAHISSAKTHFPHRGKSSQRPQSMEQNRADAARETLANNLSFLSLSFFISQVEMGSEATSFL